MKVMYQILLLSVIFWTSCEDAEEQIPDNIPCMEYEYQMPDLSKATSMYQIDAIPHDVIMNMIEAGKKYGVELGYSELCFSDNAWYWEFFPIEFGANGDTVYVGHVSDGTKRELQKYDLERDVDSKPKVESERLNTKYIKVGCRCWGKFNQKSFEYYPFYTFSFDNEWVLPKSPYINSIGVTSKDNFVLESIGFPEHESAYSVSFGDVESLIDKIIKTLGVELVEIKGTIIEKNKDNDVIKSRYFDDDTFLSEKDARSIDIVIKGYCNVKNSSKNWTELVEVTINDVELKNSGVTHIVFNDKLSYTMNVHIPYKAGGSGRAMKIAQDLGYEFVRCSTTKIVEKDKDGNILYEGRLKNDVDYSVSEANATLLEIYMDLYCRLKETSELPFLCGTIKYEVQLNQTGKNDDIYSSSQYTIEYSDVPHLYKVISGGPSTIDIVTDLGYDFASSGISKIIEKNKNGEILYQGVRTDHLDQEYSISALGARTVDVYIDFYGRPKGTIYDKPQLGTVKFDNIPLNEKGETIIYLDNCQYTVETISSDKLQHPYKVFSGGPSTIDIVEGLGYDFANSGISIIIEKDKDGNILYQGLKTDNPDKDYSISAKGARVVDVYIDFYGRPKGTIYNKYRLGAVKFENIPLNEKGETLIYLDDYQYTVYTEDL